MTAQTNRHDDEAGREGAPLVVMEAITKRFPGVVANHRVDLELREGEIHALVGENGAGKSTLMRILYGLYPPEGGRIAVRGSEVRIHSPRQAIALGIGMVHQHFVLVDRFTVTENIVLGAEGGAVVDFDEAAGRIGELARSYGFAVDPAVPVEGLSVGQGQRGEILKALSRGVALLILEDPTAVLTPSAAAELFENLRKLRADGKTVVFISHKLDEMLAIADRITVLRRGKVVGETTPAQTSKAQLAEMMVGRAAAGRGPGGPRTGGAPPPPGARHDRGLVLDMSLWENSILGRQSKPEVAGGLGILLIGKIKEWAARLIKKFDVRASSIQVSAATLSGGNQQKLILARELEETPRLVVAHQPTRGLVVGAIEFVWRKILEQKALGAGVLLISAELEEIYELSDRIVTIYEGRITGEYAADAPPAELGIGMTGGRVAQEAG